MNKSVFKIYFSSTLTTLFILFIFICSIKLNVINLPYKVRSLASNFLPQGWGFFTKSFDKQNVLYDAKSNELVSFTNGDSRNYFGFSKLSRRIGIESERLISRVDTTKKINNEYIVKRDTTLFYYLKNGSYYVVERETPPIIFLGKKYKPKEKITHIKLVN